MASSQLGRHALNARGPSDWVAPNVRNVDRRLSPITDQQPAMLNIAAKFFCSIGRGLNDLSVFVLQEWRFVAIKLVRCGWHSELIRRWSSYPSCRGYDAGKC